MLEFAPTVVRSVRAWQVLPATNREIELGYLVFAHDGPDAPPSPQQEDAALLGSHHNSGNG
jgi:hypothetical protein